MLVSERFDKFVLPDPNSGCWLWAGSTNNPGYGHFRYGGKLRLAHRVSYEALIGPIPDGLVLDHLCRVPCCVNPLHLEPVTQKVNCERGMASYAASKRHSSKTHCKNGHPLSVENVRIWIRFGKYSSRVCKACGRDRDRARRPRKSIPKDCETNALATDKGRRGK